MRIGVGDIWVAVWAGFLGVGCLVGIWKSEVGIGVDMESVEPLTMDLDRLRILSEEG